LQSFLGIAFFPKIGGGDCWRGVPSFAQKIPKKILEKNFMLKKIQKKFQKIKF